MNYRSVLVEVSERRLNTLRVSETRQSTSVRALATTLWSALLFRLNTAQ